MYVVTASLYFLVFVALKQLQGAVKGTQVRDVAARGINVPFTCPDMQRTIKEYEQAARGGSAPAGRGAQGDTLTTKSRGRPRRVLK